ncbi:transposase [Sphingosinicella sp.]|uniref:transposase n=1 Tax=Sphingosinicella sp. TaxID=1917971 RepID=UPI0040379606
MPSDPDGLRRTFGDLHRRYTGYVNARARRTGHLWQGRFGSAAMDDEHLVNALRYVSFNPVRAKLVERCADWRWSSVAAHLTGKDDPSSGLSRRSTGSGTSPPSWPRRSTRLRPMRR